MIHANTPEEEIKLVRRVVSSGIQRRKLNIITREYRNVPPRYVLFFFFHVDDDILARLSSPCSYVLPYAPLISPVLCRCCATIQ